jgi:hypothetical protein
MRVICIEEAAFYELINEVMARLKTKPDDRWNWVSDKEAMKLLNIKSKTTLQRLRDEGKIRFSQPQKKIILYDRNSIDEYLNINARDVF